MVDTRYTNATMLRAFKICSADVSKITFLSFSFLYLSFFFAFLLLSSFYYLPAIFLYSFLSFLSPLLSLTLFSYQLPLLFQLPFIFSHSTESLFLHPSLISLVFSHILLSVFTSVYQPSIPLLSHLSTLPFFSLILLHYTTPHSFSSLTLHF